MKIKLFVFTKYSQNGASSRVRFFRYRKYLDDEYDITVSPLWGEDYLIKLYSGEGVGRFKIFKAYFLRLLDVFKCLFSDAKVIWIEKELFPWLPIPIEFIFKVFGKKVIFDYDDAVFNNYKKGLFSIFFNFKFRCIAHLADSVMCGNEYIINYFSKLGCKRVDYIPTVIDIDKYSEKSSKSTSKLIIGWIGSPSTQKYLSIVDDAIYKLQKNYSVEFHVIGANRLTHSRSNVTYIDWAEDTEVDNLKLFDVGIMPLFDSEFERGKCGYKLIQYLALGIPVLASPVGVNVNIVTDGVNGYLCENDEWFCLLQGLVEDRDKLQCMGKASRKSVASFYTYQAQNVNIISIISELLSPR
ncbi:glycosyltransferase [Vibrio cyclitrophicus]